MQADTLNIIQNDTSVIRHTSGSAISNSQNQSIHTTNTAKPRVVTLKPADTSLVKTDTISADTLHKKLKEPEAPVPLFDLFPSLHQSSDSAVVNTIDKTLL